MASSAAQPTFLSPAEGESFSIIGGGVRILADGTTTGGRCCMFECPVPAGDGPPLHRHEREDEIFYVLEGRFMFSVDRRIFIGERGAFAVAPRGSLHTFRNIGEGRGVLHVTCSPAGLETAFRAVRIPEPGSAGSPLTPEQLMAVFATYGITFHGPPLTGNER